MKSDKENNFCRLWTLKFLVLCLSEYERNMNQEYSFSANVKNFLTYLVMLEHVALLKHKFKAKYFNISALSQPLNLELDKITYLENM